MSRYRSVNPSDLGDVVTEVELRLEDDPPPSSSPRIVRVAMKRRDDIRAEHRRVMRVRMKSN